LNNIRSDHRRLKNVHIVCFVYLLHCSLVHDILMNMKEKTKIVGSRQQALKSQPPSSTAAQYPPPLNLIEIAEREPERKRVEESAEVMSKLRDTKGFTFRAIADWLCKHGVPTDHNEVFRTHKNYCEGALKRYFERNPQHAPAKMKFDVEMR
jgi:hypothetical protein